MKLGAASRIWSCCFLFTIYITLQPDIPWHILACWLVDPPQVTVPTTVRRPWQVLRDVILQTTGKPHLSEQSWVFLLECIQGPAAGKFIHRSLAELAAFLHFVEQGGRPPHWSTECHDQYKVAEPRAWLASRTHWENIANDFGYSVDIADESLSRMDGLSDEEKEVWHRYEATLANAKHANLRGDGMSWVELEQNLLQPWVPKPISKHPMDMGQLLHGCVAVLRRRAGAEWASWAALLNGLCEERLRRLPLHSTARILCAIVFTEDHWGILLSVKGNSKAMVYDGLQKKQLQDAGLALMLHCADQGWCQPESDIGVVFGTVPCQRDSWSCGHRVLLHLDFAIKHLQEHDELPAEIPESAVTPETIKVLLDNNQSLCIKPCEELMVDQAALDDHAKTTKSSDCKEVSMAAGPKSSDETRAPRTPIQSKKSIRQARNWDETTPDAERPHKRVRKSNPEKLSKQDMLEKSKEDCKKLCIDHNGWQKLHYAADLPPKKGYWQKFLIAFASKRASSACPVCNKLLQKAHGTQDSPMQDERAPPLQVLGLHLFRWFMLVHAGSCVWSFDVFRLLLVKF